MNIMIENVINSNHLNKQKNNQFSGSNTKFLYESTTLKCQTKNLALSCLELGLSIYTKFHRYEIIRLGCGLLTVYTHTHTETLLFVIIIQTSLYSKITYTSNLFIQKVFFKCYNIYFILYFEVKLCLSFYHCPK